MAQSGWVSPSPSPFGGSLLVTPLMRQRGAAAWQASAADTLRVTATILWFGGQRTPGVAWRLLTVGAARSATDTITSSDATPPFPSSTVSTIRWLPIGNLTDGEGPLTVPNGPTHE